MVAEPALLRSSAPEIRGEALPLLPSACEMAHLDKSTIDTGITGRELMERAGKAIAERILAEYPLLKRCVVLCGSGNNGGDGLVITRLLRQRGIETGVVIAASSRLSCDCQAQLARISDCYAFGGDVIVSDSKLSPICKEELVRIISHADVIVDALLGTGQRAAPRGVVGELVTLVMSAKASLPGTAIVSVDIPTGVDGDTGVIYEPHVVADLTCTVEFVKRGMLQFPARAACGVISVSSIGIRADPSVEYSLVTDRSVPRLTPRLGDVHKGLLGKVIVVGGSVAMPGAPMLSALGALRTGAGIVSRVVRKVWLMTPQLPEAMFEIVEGTEDFFHAGDLDVVREIAARYDVLVLGPGLGVDPKTQEFVEGLLDWLKNRSMRVVIDADALNHLAKSGRSLSSITSVVTPHPGEAARLLGVSSQRVQSDRYSAARQLAQRFGCVCVLKGAGTVIHDGAKGRVVADGTPYLATPGSGDVLAGIMATCLARSATVFDAATTAVWLHAHAGIKAAQLRGGPIVASDIASELGEFVGRVEGHVQG